MAKGKKEDAFWANVERTAGCWNYRGPLRKGWGLVRVGDRTVRAHRYAFVLHRGREPGPLLAQTCGNRRCVRDDHLVEGMPPKREIVRVEPAPAPATLVPPPPAGGLFEVRSAREDGETRVSMAIQFRSSRFAVTFAIRAGRLFS